MHEEEGEMIEFFKEDGEKVGIYDICEWWIDKYPEEFLLANQGKS